MGECMLGEEVRGRGDEMRWGRGGAGYGAALFVVPALVIPVVW